jgi:hypothetical protein
MPDRVDQLMTKHWARLQSSINKGLKVDPELKKYLSVGVDDSFKPYRIASPRDPDPVDPRLTTPIESEVEADLRRFDRKAIDGAFELIVGRELSLASLDGDTPELMMAELGTQARLAERRAVLGRLGWQPGRLPKLNKENVGEGVDDLGRPCTLVWSGDAKGSTDEYATLVDDFVDPKDCLPDDIVAILVPQVGGPAFTRLIDDLTPSWMRASSTAVRVSLTERFFLVQPARAKRFVA